MNRGVKTSEFLLPAIVLIGIFTLIGIGKLPADMTTLGALVTLALGYGAQRTFLKAKTNAMEALNLFERKKKND